MSDMPAHRAADSGLVELCRCPQSNDGPLVMVTTWVVLGRVSLFLVPVAVGSGAVRPLQASPLHPFG